MQTPALSGIVTILSLASILGAGGLAYRLYRCGLHEQYPWFFRYLCAEFAFGAVTTLLQYGPRPRYRSGIAFLVLQPLLWPLYIAMVLEIHRKALSRYAGIARLGQQLLVGGLVVSMLLSIATIQPELQAAGHTAAQAILTVTAGQRVVTGGLSIFLLLLTAFVSWFPVPMSRNTILHTSVAFLFFLSMTVAHLYRNLTGSQVTEGVNIGILSMSVFCLLVWAFRFLPGNEFTPRPAGGSGPDGQWFVNQLEAINRALLRSTK